MALMILNFHSQGLSYIVAATVHIYTRPEPSTASRN